MFNKIRSVLPLADYSLMVCFENGERKINDISKLFEKRESLRAMAATNGLFKQVKVDSGGYGIRWNENAYLSCDELYKSGRTVPKESNLIIYTPKFLVEDEEDEVEEA